MRAARAEPANAETATSDGAADQRSRAKQLYEAGLGAYRAGEYSTAIDKLLEADQVMPNAAFSYNIALVYEAMGDKRSALRWFRNFLRQSDKASDLTAAQSKVRKLEAELQAKGLQQVTILSAPSGAMLKIDGQAAGVSPFTTEITPGRHQVTLTMDGFEQAQRTFELRPDRSMDIELKLVAAKVAEPAATPAPVPSNAPGIGQTSGPLAPTSVTAPPEPDRQRRHVRPFTWLSFGLGAALLGGATVFELKRQRAEDSARAASQTTYQSQWDKMESPQTTARVLAVAGSVVMATGLVLLTVDLTRSGPVQTASAGSCSSNGICAALRGQF